MSSSSTRIVDGREYRVISLSLNHGTPRLRKGRLPADRAAALAAIRTEIDDEAICVCDAYAPHKRPGKCPIHA